MSAREIRPVDHDVRHRAITETARPVSVEAGAGTGKTYLLTHRFVHLVESGAATPSQIVAITFTEKAAAQLRDKIREELTKRNRVDAIEELDRAPISTIHSFAGSLLRERPFEAAVDPNFEQLDAFAGNLFLQGAYDRWLASALDRIPASVDPLSRALAAGISLDRVGELAMELYAHRDLLPGLSLVRSTFDPEVFFAALLRETEALWSLASRSCVNVEDAGYREIEALHREADAVRDATRATKERALLIRLRASAKGNRANWADPEICREQKDRMKALGERLEQAHGRLRAEIFADLLRWLSSFVSFVEREKASAGKLDFDDLLFKARDLVKLRADVREYFRRKYRFILVDEFQDTDPVQTELIWFLASEGDRTPSRWDALPLTSGKLFIVGDPKQSIYRFRRASIEVYAAARDHVARAGSRLVIRQNFRASPPLVSWINAIFGTVLSEGYETIEADAGHLSPPGLPSVLRVEDPVPGPADSAPAARRAEADAIAACLRSLIDDPRPRIFDPRTEVLRPIRPQDVAILFPSTTDIDLYEEALRRYDLPFSLEGGQLFYQRTEIHSALSVLDAIAHPTDPIAVVAALRSVLFALSDQDLSLLARTGIPLDYRRADTSGLPEPIPAAFSVLRDLHAVHESLAPSQIVRELFRRTSAIPLTLARPHGEQAVANLERFLSLARAHERLEGASLDRFTEWARERTEEAERQGESPLTEEEERRIRLMTVHKAKGLEFPVVVLAKLTAQSDQREIVVADRFRGQLALGIGAKEKRFATPEFEGLSAAEKGRCEEERRRLLYVACTRTRDLLILPYFPTQRGAPGNLWALLEPALPAGAPWTETIPVSALPLREPRRSDEEVTRSEPDDVLQRQNVRVRKLLDERNSGWIPGLAIRTATELVRHNRPKVSSGLRSSSAAAIGSALHAILERIDPVPRMETLPTLCHATAAEFGVPDAAAELQMLARNALQSDLFARIARARAVYRETPFSFRKEGTLYEGVIDLIFEEPGGLIVVDYKTDRVSDADLAARVEAYAPQLSLYAEALRSITGKSVPEALLFFVRLPRSISVPVPSGD
ncbi:MAG: UvrD-helicase domain-containing protein [Pseudomonadota bacterium]